VSRFAPSPQPPSPKASPKASPYTWEPRSFPIPTPKGPHANRAQGELLCFGGEHMHLGVAETCDMATGATDPKSYKVVHRSGFTLGTAKLSLTDAKRVAEAFHALAGDPNFDPHESDKVRAWGNTTGELRSALEAGEPPAEAIGR